MFGNSETVSSNQTHLHPGLEKIVRRHQRTPWRAPVADHDRVAFAGAQSWREARGMHRPMILDSGCGTARSSVRLALRYPEALVFGLDQSEHRLAIGRAHV